MQCDDDAVRAERDGKGVLILGRPCRTEMARAHCKLILCDLHGVSLTNVASFIVFKTSRQPTEAHEASKLLGQLGEIAKVEPLEEGIQRALRLPPAMLISYKMYDPRRDVVQVSTLHIKLPQKSNV